MSVVKRERWTEADVDALPAGEHDYFERKAGKLFVGTEDLLLAKMAKAVSALANSGGGHLLLGVEDNGVLDGVPPVYRGSTATRDWLEQIVPNLVSYALADFRVHVVEPAAVASRIPSGRQVIVIDVGDSAMAPHQCMRSGADARSHVYYRRVAGRSEPAPHFYLELLRQRLVSPVLEATPKGLRIAKVAPAEGKMFLALRMQFLVRNVGRVAAYKWGLWVERMSGHVANRQEDYRFGMANYPPIGGMNSSIRVDDSILPAGAMTEDVDLGVVLRAKPPTPDEFATEIAGLLRGVTLHYRLVTETSAGELHPVAIGGYVDAEAWGSSVHAAWPPSWPT
jgi:hypothetical protein